MSSSNENKIIEDENDLPEKDSKEEEKKVEIKEEPQEPPIIPEPTNEDLSALSFSSYDSVDNIKIDKMGQYTCDKCSEIPKIIGTNLEKKTILFKCKEHGHIERDIREYLLNALNYNTNNWKCSQCQNIQRNIKDNFIFCQCGSVFCNECSEVHKKDFNHPFKIQSDKYNLRCKTKVDHYDEQYIGFCYDCNTHYCKKCETEQTHNLHSVTPINTMYIEEAEIEKIRKLNKEYRSLISYYESLIRLNNLIIHSYKNYRNNYYNCHNINTIINNYKRNIVVNDSINKSSPNEVNQIILPGEKNENLIKYMKDLYKEEIKEEETDSVEIDNKFFNNLDFKVLTQIPIKNLHVLSLENNGITNINCLAKADFPELVIVNLNNNAIEDISVFENVKFVEFQALLLRNNNIKNISVFGTKKFEFLREIDLRNNSIEDIGVFEKHQLPFLQCLYLTYNKFDINDKKFEKAIERIKKELIEYELTQEVFGPVEQEKNENSEKNEIKE